MFHQNKFPPPRHLFCRCTTLCHPRWLWLVYKRARAFFLPLYQYDDCSQPCPQCWHTALWRNLGQVLSVQYADVRDVMYRRSKYSNQNHSLSLYLTNVLAAQTGAQWSPVSCASLWPAVTLDMTLHWLVQSVTSEWKILEGGMQWSTITDK